MTIRELYNWAEENNCLDLDLYKNINLDMYPIEKPFVFDYREVWGKSLAEICNIKPRVVLD